MPSRYIGAITGTSMDGLDLALLTVAPAADSASHSENAAKLTISNGTTVALPADLHRELAALATTGDNEIERLGPSDRALGTFIGQAVLDYLADLKLQPTDIVAIGSHGQTIRHRPVGPNAFTLQIGDPNCIAEQTGICTVADFRRRDVAAGGQGAPLVPLFHEALFAGRAGQVPPILNIGGISNLTLHGSAGAITGFDTGPGNGLMDAWIDQHRGEPFDQDGNWAASADMDETLLAQLLADPYFNLPPPKSTGREHFCMDWIVAHPRAATLEPAVVQATLTELTARSVVDALSQHASKAQALLVCGGGRHNRQLMARLTALSGLDVEPTDDHGVDGDSLEAAAFAWLAWRTLQALPGNAPGVTGALGPRVLGGIFPGASGAIPDM